MASIGSSVLPASALLTTPKVMNVDLPTANTEYQVTIPAGVKKFTLQNRFNGLVKIGEAAGDIAGNSYFTLFPGCAYNADSITGNGGIILYVAPAKASQVLEVWYWL